MRRLASAVSIALIAAFVGGPALATTDEEWAAFRKDVEAKCLKAAEPMIAGASATVDPFGSSTYGLALIRGKAVGAEGTAIMAICVYDKQKKTVEIGGELPVQA